jgi:hypothetical protein
VKHDGSPVQLRAYRPGDEAAILDCYNRIFPDPERGVPPRSLAHWNWKFLANPVARVMHAVAEHEQLGIVGAYGGLPCRIWSEGREQLAAQGVDVMVLPEWRRHGPRPGLLVHLGWKFHELYCGAGDGQVLFVYGWPMGNWRAGQRYLGYWNICDWDVVFRELEGAPARAVPASLAVREVARFGSDVDALWERVKGELGLALLRDARYLNWRYADAPDRRYRLFECRDVARGELRGVCVYTVSDFLRPHTGFLVDWLAPADDQDATVAMVGALEQRAQEDRVGILGCVWNHRDPRFVPFQRLGFLLRGTPYFLVLPSFKYDLKYFREQWYFTMGDSDLI